MKRWYKYIKPYLPYFILGPLCMIVEVIGEVLMPKLLAFIIDFGVDGVEGKEDVPKALLWLFDKLGGNAGFIIAIAVGMILTAVLMMIGGVGGAWFGAKASVNFAADLRGDIYAKIQEFSFANIDKFSTGSLVTRLTNDVTQLQNFVNMMLRMFFLPRHPCGRADHGHRHKPLPLGGAGGFGAGADRGGGLYCGQRIPPLFQDPEPH